MAQSFRYWNISLGGDRQVLHIMICYGGECTVRVKYVPTEQVFQIILHIVLLLLKIKSNYIYKKTVRDYLVY